MKLTVATPLAIVVQAEHVVHLRAEDATGSFGILQGHADFLTALAISVVTWRDDNNAEHHVAVRGGLLEVNLGEQISIATREAIAGDDLKQLERTVLAKFRQERDEEAVAHIDAERLYLAAIRQIYRLIRPGYAHPARQQTSGGRT
jgi:F-type H+-transporting ATPase subunit epsilon